MRKTLPAVLASALAGAAAPAAEAEVFVAYGEGATLCTIQAVRSEERSIWTGGEPELTFYGDVDCNVALEQTAHATVDDFLDWPGLDGGLCSGVRASCYSGREGVRTQNPEPMVFQMSLRAPLGQGWLGAPTNCSGVGTDNLKCEFVIPRDWRLPL